MAIHALKSELAHELNLQSMSNRDGLALALKQFVELQDTQADLGYIVRIISSSIGSRYMEVAVGRGPAASMAGMSRQGWPEPVFFTREL